MVGPIPPPRRDKIISSGSRRAGTDHGFDHINDGNDSDENNRDDDKVVNFSD